MGYAGMEFGYAGQELAMPGQQLAVPGRYFEPIKRLCNMYDKNQINITYTPTTSRNWNG
ncbi:MAG: hypothetical protein GY940_01275 [bacterium]|nr:hypothetical protein [bacterium]